MATTASVGCWIVGSGTSSSAMSPTPWKTTASMDFSRGMECRPVVISDR